MNIIFLGTGTSQGVPVIACDCHVCSSTDPRDHRLRSSILVDHSGKKIVIDCGPDFRQQMLRLHIRSIDAILVTHGHKDHLGGLDDVRAFNYVLQRPADVFATREVQKMIRREYAYAFDKEPYPGVPEINLHTFGSRPFEINGLRIIPIKALHYNQVNYVFGFRIDDFTYITDAVFISEHEKQKIRGSRIIVVNALRRKKHYSHFNLEEAVGLLNEMNPEQGFLTHISHQMGTYNEVSRELPGYIQMAYDGLRVEL